MARHGVLTKETHATTLRFAPPLVIEETDLLQAVDVFEQSLKKLTPVRLANKPNEFSHSESLAS
jgi:ornithine--oxo-acid transaminase